MVLERFQQKDPRDLVSQAVGNSEYLRALVGQPLIPPTINDPSILGNLSKNEVVELYGAKRMEILTTVMRADLTGRELSNDEKRTIGRWLTILNGVDQYIADHEAGKNRVLYPKQFEVFKALGKFLKDGGMEGFFKLPTAFGKSVVFTEFIKAANLKTLVVVPTQDLVEQTETTLSDFAPGLDVGKVYQFDENFDDQITLITYDSLVRHLRNRQVEPEEEDLKPEEFDLVILDEAHHALGPESQWAVAQFPNSFKFGFTATPTYADDRHLGQILANEIFSMSIKEAVEEEILAPFKVWLLEMDIDLSGVDVSRITGDYSQGQLARALDTAEIHSSSVNLYKKHFEGKQGFAFYAYVKQAKDAAAFFRRHGIKAEAVYGEMDPNKRREILEVYRSGEIQILCSKQLLIEGVDFPNASFVFNVVPTFSPRIAEQRGGRPERLNPLDPEKEATIVDYVYKDTRYGMSVTFAEVAESARAVHRSKIRHEVSQGEEVIMVDYLGVDQKEKFGPHASLVTNISEVMRIASSALASRRPDVLPVGYSRLYTASLMQEFKVSDATISKNVRQLKDLYPEDFLFGTARIYIVSPQGLSLLRQELQKYVPPEGYVRLPTGILAKELNVSPQVVTDSAGSLGESFPEHVIRQGIGKPIFITEFGITVLRENVTKTRPSAGRHILQSTGFIDRFGAGVVGRSVARLNKTYPQDVIRLGTNRPILLTPRGIALLRRDLLTPKIPKGFKSPNLKKLAEEYGLSPTGVQNYFYALSKEYPRDLVKRGRNKSLIVSKLGEKLLRQALDATKPTEGFVRLDSNALAAEYDVPKHVSGFQIVRLSKEFPDELKRHGRNKGIDITPECLLLLQERIKEAAEKYESRRRK